MFKKIIIILSVVSGLILLSNCKATENSAPVVMSGEIMLNGSAMSDNKKSSNYNLNDMMTFRGNFTDSDGNETISRAVVSYSVNMGMMNHTGEITMWDDGTHGDPISGDGWYHMEDEIEQMLGMMGIGWEMMTGDYNFEFYCFDEDGNESGHLKVGFNLN